MAKYKQYYTKMIEENRNLFFEFKNIHDKFKSERSKHQAEFNRIGQKVRDVIRDWDRRLCSAMGKGQYSQYSYQLSEKFWNHARKEFEFIDLVGVKVKK
ncbi:MAG: hypothetical protein PVJ09_00505 [Candidatus Woesebacteria bacterium]|jgi:hypothetical protein